MNRLATLRTGVEFVGGPGVLGLAGYVLVAPGPLSMPIRLLMALLFAVPGCLTLLDVHTDLV